MSELSLQQAFEHFQAGRLREAQELCRQVLTSDPKQPDALHLMGLLALRAGQPNPAVELISRAVEIDRSSPGYHASLGQALAALGRLDDAVASYQRAIDLHAGFPEAHSNLAGVLQRLGRSDEAIEQCHAAIKLRPDWWLAHYNLGLILAASKKMNEAVASLDRAAKLEPNNPQLWNDLGSALRAMGKLDESIDAYHRAIARSPNFIAAHVNLGNVLRDAGRNDEAIAAFERALSMKPDFAEAQIALGMSYRSAGKTDEAFSLLQKALARWPDSPETHNGFGSVLHDLGRYDQAIEHFKQALKLRPDWTLPLYHLGFEYLLKGDFAQGWPAYEARLGAAELSRSKLKLNGQRWNGEVLGGQTILLHAEQGLGDAIQFVRYVPHVKIREGRIILMCHPELQRLFQTIHGASQILNLTDPPPSFDVHCSLLSLPGIFGTNLQSIPSKVPYLSADSESTWRWSQQLASHPAKKRIGLCWEGRRHIRGRSIELSTLAPLTKIDGLKFVSLQKDAPPSTIPELIDWTSELHDLADTAALIQNLDLVVTIDTAVAHLAGALGKPVWVLLPFVPDWRWMLNRNDSPWYPTMKLFRQPSPGDWTEPIARVVAALNDFKDSQ